MKHHEHCIAASNQTPADPRFAVLVLYFLFSLDQMANIAFRIAFFLGFVNCWLVREILPLSAGNSRSARSRPAFPFILPVTGCLFLPSLNVLCW